MLIRVLSSTSSVQENGTELNRRHIPIHIFYKRSKQQSFSYMLLNPLVSDLNVQRDVQETGF
jgi:hypothetical protein